MICFQLGNTHNVWPIDLSQKNVRSSDNNGLKFSLCISEQCMSKVSFFSNYYKTGKSIQDMVLPMFNTNEK